jgi:hypothetical protein
VVAVAVVLVVINLVRLAVLASLLLDIQALNVAQAVLLLQQEGTPTTPSHHQALTQHKGKTHVTFCKSSRRHRYTSYRC